MFSSLAEIQTKNANVKIGTHSWKIKLAATLRYYDTRIKFRNIAD